MSSQFWVLVKVPRDKTLICSQLAPGWRIAGALTLVDWGLSGYNTDIRSWTIVSNVFGECHVHAKDIICRFRKRECALVAATDDQIVRPYPTLYIFSVAVKSR